MNKLKDIWTKIKRRVRLIYNFFFVNSKKRLTIKVILLSGYYRYLVKYLSSEKLESKMGMKNVESPLLESKENTTYAYQIGLRVDQVCDKTYWESKCLIKALTAQRLLSQKGVETTIYMGVGLEEGKMIAHSWLRCGELFVTGGNGEGYSIVAKFAK